MARHARIGGNDVALLVWGQAVSAFGSRSCALAFPLLALLVTGSPALAGVLGLVVGLPVLALQLPAGVLVDRCDRRRVMLVCDLGRLALVLGVVVAGWSGELGFGLLVVTAGLHATLSVVFGLAQSAALPMLVDSAALPRVAARQQSALQAATVAGHPVGGWAFTVFPVAPFALNAVTHVVSLATLLGIRGRLNPVRPLTAQAGPDRTRWAGELLDGLRYVRRDPTLRALAILSAGTALVAGGFTLVLIVLLRDRGASPAEIGVLFGACGVAGLLGATLTPWLLHRLGAGRIYVAALGLSALAALSLPATQQTWHVGVLAAAIVGLGAPPAVVVGVARARTIPRHLFARVRGVENTLAAASAPLGSLLSGLALSSVGPATTCLLVGAGLTLATIGAAATPAVRDLAEGTPSTPRPTGSRPRHGGRHRSAPVSTAGRTVRSAQPVSSSSGAG